MHIIEFIETTIHSQEEYDALPKKTRDQYEQAKEIQIAEELAWASACAELEIAEFEREQRARIEAIWEAGIRSCSESPNSVW